ncbi:hypothetical protein KUTeg_001892 [Tegillarca granosa]|uniref:Ig-like domain-containing protein n=1 Tax=Tegillarca granosa TaxID=220873 RepID=A0ABQ9FVI4_TEGGR|nr:hypothetical protein KUTeg_001892 [Tegillarca granosa]
MKYMISCYKSENSIKLKLFNVSSTKHGAEIECVLRINGILYKNTTSIYVQVPLKTASIVEPKEKKIQRYKSIQLQCQTSPSRPKANITWSVVKSTTNKPAISVGSQKFYNDSQLTTTTSYLNFSTNSTQSEEIVVCKASNGISSVSSNITLEVIYPPDTVKIILDDSGGTRYAICNAESKPVSNITWKVNGSEQNTDPMVKTRKREVKCGDNSLVLVCKATNELGMKQEQLTVPAKPCASPPENTIPGIMDSMSNNEWLTTNNKWILIAAIIAALLIFVIVTTFCFSRQCNILNVIPAGISKVRRSLRQRATPANSTVPQGAEQQSNPENHDNMASNDVPQISTDPLVDVYARIQQKTKGKKVPIGQAVSMKSLVVVHSLSKNQAKSKERLPVEENTTQDEHSNYVDVDFPENGTGEVHGLEDKTVYTLVNIPSECATEAPSRNKENVKKGQNIKNTIYENA